MIVGLGLSLMVAVATVSSVTAAPLVLSIAAQPPMVKSGRDIRVDVDLVNRSDQPIPLSVTTGSGSAEFDYEINVTRQDGRPVERTDYGLSLAGAGTLVLGVGRRSLALRPGRSFQDYFTLNKIFDVARPGTYFVQIEPGLIAGKTIATRSNKIKLVVY